MAQTEDSYRPLTGLIYIFNLIVGTGALTMPGALKHAGWVTSIFFLVILCLVSFVTTTFVVEAMAVANALRKSKAKEQAATARYAIGSSQSQLQGNVDDSCFDSDDSVEGIPLLSCAADDDATVESLFDITERVELGTMAGMFFNKIGVQLFYFCMAVYLFGDLAIYGAAISNNYMPANCTPNQKLSLDLPCWEQAQSISRQNAYRLFLVAVTVLIGPFAFFNVQKTKHLQLLTSFLRWTAFISMITLATITLFKGKNLGHPDAVDFRGIPSLFGVCVYSFMCHHSLPGLITPISKKNNLFRLIFSDYCLILIFYSLLSFTGIFAFPDIQDIYTLNFQVEKCGGASNSTSVTQVPVLNYFLPLFPVFTLSTSFPIIAVTLTMNLKALFLSGSNPPAYDCKTFFIYRLLFPLIAVVPPFFLALVTENLEILVGVVGSYAGATIQYAIPAFLVFFARQKLNQNFCLSHLNEIHLFSPFRHRIWVWLVLIWCVISLAFVTTNHIIQMTGK